MAAPAPGSSKVHEVEQKAIIDQALGLLACAARSNTSFGR
jgi:hypothetical protein